ncbi:dihydrofolate reductase [Streptomyces sp. CB01881]|uniref:2-hydroxyacid dehydrogenase n=1 Tax=Streptomyces sp. CB01881 TaxID=2078691 RepID=UPI0011DF9DF7|nr:2-hydroxyacid dehydrogenase [Streptomyces sp. CB01881]TYC68206.1 dihydrofolate reductase [Streptomyces sp. CB01881]
MNTAKPSAGPRLLLPFTPAELGGLPEGWSAAMWDGTGEEPAGPRLAAVEFFVIPYTFTHAALDLLPRLPGLRVLQSLSIGVDDLLPRVPPGVTLCNATGVHEASTAEHAVTLLLAALRRIPDLVRAQQAQQWVTGFRPALADRTVLLLGYGAIGAAVEARIAPFECRVLRVARTARQSPRGPVQPLGRLPLLLPQADAVVLTLPLTAQTRGLVDAAVLARLKDGALVVNVGRGAVVDTDALLAELRSGRLAAALDVTDPEPLPPGHPLWTAPNTLISPHAAATTSAFRPRALALVRAQVSRYAAGDPLANVIVTGAG